MRALNLVTCRFLSKTAKHDTTYTLIYQKFLDGFSEILMKDVILMPNKILSFVSISVVFLTYLVNKRGWQHLN